MKLLQGFLAVFLENGTLMKLLQGFQHPTRGDVEASSFRCLERRKFGNGLGFVITGEGTLKLAREDQANEENIKGHQGKPICFGGITQVHTGLKIQESHGLSFFGCRVDLLSGAGIGNFEEIGPLDVHLKPRNSTWLKIADLLLG
ncbi:hypothetical protein OROHE_012251 [Orobanche hederae]